MFVAFLHTTTERECRCASCLWGTGTVRLVVVHGRLTGLDAQHLRVYARSPRKRTWSSVACTGTRSLCIAYSRSEDTLACTHTLSVMLYVLSCAVPCWEVLCCAVLCCAVLCCAVLCCVVLRCAVEYPRSRRGSSAAASSSPP